MMSEGSPHRGLTDSPQFAPDPSTDPVSGLWRSEHMELISVRFHRDMLDTALRRIGTLGFVEIRGTTDSSQRKRGGYVAQVRLCESIERRLRYFDELIPRFPPIGMRAASPAGTARDTLLQGMVKEAPPLGVPSFGAARTEHWSESPDALDALDEQMQAEERQLRAEGMGLVPTLEQGVQRYLADLEQLALLGALSEQGSAINRVDDECLSAASSHELQEFDGPGAVEQRPLRGQQQVRGEMFRGELVGTLSLGALDAFLRLAVRTTKNNAFTVTQHIAVISEAPGVDMNLLTAFGDNVEQTKVAFRVMYTAEAAQWKLHRLCQSLGVRVVFATPVIGLTSSAADEQARMRREALERLGVPALPASTQEILHAMEELRVKVRQDVDLLQRTNLQIREEMQTVARHQLARRQYILKEKAMFHALNAMSIVGDSADATCWVPSRRLRELSSVFDDMRDSGGRRPILRRLHHSDAVNPDGGVDPPPTHYETNVVTGTFQGIVDSYGVPRYREVNPAVWTMVTFPWLFGVMYGDVGHGLLITIAAALCIVFERQLDNGPQNEIFEMIFGARYLLLLMGLFAIYLGFLYNDTFGFMFEYSPSRYNFPVGWETLRHDNGTNAPACFDGEVPLACGACSLKDIVQFNYSGTVLCGCPLPEGKGMYPCATPPGWPEAHNGVGLMSPPDGPTPFGLDVAWAETENKIDFYNSFKMKNAVILGVVQMLGGLVLSLFNYVGKGDYTSVAFRFVPEVVFLLFTFGFMCILIMSKWTTEFTNTHIAPNVLETMTNFFLSPGAYTEFDAAACAKTGECGGYETLFSGQQGTQVFLLVVAVMMVPLLLVPLPVLQWKRKQTLELQGEFEAAAKIDMQEVVIKQVIHTIEYVLGCVSNTASYLRLWALSLAHSQLSDVFLKFTLLQAFDTAKGAGDGVLIYMGFGVWFTITLGVLVVMEGLSAFLHALRLHWVEFQNKFYAGDGRAFAPLDFAELLKQAGCPERD